MDLLAVQSYFKVHREIIDFEQVEREIGQTMYLYNHKIVTELHHFLLEDVWDLSYRSIGDGGGMLYLHTIQGLYPYLVKTSPQEFIEAFKTIKSFR
ncbi:hypothetical protein [Bacillus niameyensis]|uniref:hypothetical protein n=1 Tax=Bacillus niameyensis TaxID=1522308 RepID=UPI00078586F0|nr:hypothetical protein [Bacillus niameyensis]